MEKLDGKFSSCIECGFKKFETTDKKLLSDLLKV